MNELGVDVEKHTVRGLAVIGRLAGPAVLCRLGEKTDELQERSNDGIDAAAPPRSYGRTGRRRGRPLERPRGKLPCYGVAPDVEAPTACFVLYLSNQLCK